VSINNPSIRQEPADRPGSCSLRARRKKASMTLSGSSFSIFFGALYFLENFCGF
jgi:hypothetical protein